MNIHEFVYVHIQDNVLFLNFQPPKVLVTGIAAYFIVGDEFAPLVSVHKPSLVGNENIVR